MVLVVFAVRAVKVRKNKKKKGNTSGNCISRIWRADPTEPAAIIFGTSRDLAGIINCAKFHIDQSMGYGGAGVQESRVLVGTR
jgi:hypothetical protein